MSVEPAYYNEEWQETKEYMEKHKINDVIQQLTMACLIEQPENPREFMIKRLENIRAARVIGAHLG